MSFVVELRVRLDPDLLHRARAEATRRGISMSALVAGALDGLLDGPDGIQLENSTEILRGVHDPSTCTGRACPIHNRTVHSMRAFPQHWRSDRGLMERICPHGVGHPDPDAYSYLVTTLGEANAQAEFSHACDGCCAA